MADKIIPNKKVLYAIIIQCIIQRVDKCRRKAIQNNKYMDPINSYNEIIQFTGLLISDRYIKQKLNLSTYDNSYIEAINNFKGNDDDFIMFIISIRKSLKLKNTILLKYNNIKNNLCLVNKILTSDYNTLVDDHKIGKFKVIL